MTRDNVVGKSVKVGTKWHTLEKVGTSVEIGTNRHNLQEIGT